MRAKIIGLFSVIVALIGVLSLVLLRANLVDLVANPDQSRIDAVRSAAAAQARLELEALTLQRWLDEQSNDPLTREPFLRENESARSDFSTAQADRIFGLASSEFRQNPPAIVAFVNERGVALGRNGSTLLRGDNLGAAYPALAVTLKKGLTGSDVWVNPTRNEQMLVSYATVRDAQNRILGGIVLGTPLDDGRIGRTTEITSGRPLAFVSFGPKGPELVAKSGNVPEPALAWFRGGSLKASPQALEPGRPQQLPAGPPGYAGAVVALSGYGDGKHAALVALSPLGLGDSLNAALLPIIGFTTLLGIVLVAFAGVVLSNYLTAPVVELERGLLAILNGQTDRRFEIEHAEYGGLVFSINSLLNHLMGVQEDTTDAEGRPSRAPSAQQFREALSVDPTPEAVGRVAGGAGGATAARLGAEPADAYLMRLYDEYIKAKRSLGDPVDHITEAAFVERIRTSELETSQRLGKPVRFKVELRGREVTLVAVPLELARSPPDARPARALAGASERARRGPPPGRCPFPKAGAGLMAVAPGAGAPRPAALTPPGRHSPLRVTMGLFDFFKSKPKSSPSAPPPAGPVDKNVARLARIVGDRLSQTYDRRDAIKALHEMKTADGVSALLRRFTFYVEPSTDDQEEKDSAYDAVIDAGEVAVKPILEFCKKAESVSWPLKMLRELLPNDKYFETVVELLGGYETDYTRNVEPKVQLLGALEGHAAPEAVEMAAYFLEDVSEPVRFQAVGILLSMNDEKALEPLAARVADEESVRVRNKIAEGFAARGWAVPEAQRLAFASAVALEGYQVGPDGRVGSPA